jgi:hypothetical protein
MNESQILSYETALRAWFTRNADTILAEIDGLDFACVYRTFLAQLGFRFPDARLIGLNIHFTGLHASISASRAEADVQASLVQADALRMPAPEGAFSSASCFLGLQDIEIGFGQAGAVEK